VWRIFVFGAGHVAQSLVRCLLELECRVVCIDTREDWLARLPENRKLTTRRTDDLPAEAAAVSETDFVVLLTMGHRTDRPILEAILQTGRRPVYLGVIGSEAKRKIMVRELVEAGVDLETAKEFRCPIGLPLGQNQPGEIAISVAAELIQVRDELLKVSN
jgi:xanthine dehydrogenase accessory factor